MATARPDDDLIGHVVLIMPSCRMVEVVSASRSLDLAFCEHLNMEGGRTGRHGMFKPSALVTA